MSGRLSQQIGSDQESKLVYEIVKQIQKNNQLIISNQSSFHIPISKPIGLSSNSNLYYEWLRSLKEISSHLSNCCTTTSTAPPIPNISLLIPYNNITNNFNIPVYDETSAGDFTIEWFAKMTSDDNHPRPWSIGNFYDGAASAVSIENGIMYYWINGTIIMSSEISGYIGVWAHFCVQRTGTTLYMYVNGSQVATTTLLSDIPTRNFPLYIASEGVESLQNGLISNFRWTVGTSIYSPGEYLVPTSPLNTSENTKLLLFQGNTLNLEITDNSGLNPINNGTGVYNADNPFIGYEGSLQFGII